MKRLLLALLAAALVTCPAMAESEPPRLAVDADPPAGGGLFGSLLDFYQGPLDHLSAVRRGECPMMPSCSEYSRQVIARHGPVVGWAMTMDRLMRCGRDGLRWAPRVIVDGRVKYLDPPAANDFWWAPADVAAAGPGGQTVEGSSAAAQNPSQPPASGQRAR